MELLTPFRRLWKFKVLLNFILAGVGTGWAVMPHCQCACGEVRTSGLAVSVAHVPKIS